MISVSFVVKYRERGGSSFYMTRRGDLRIDSGGELPLVVLPAGVTSEELDASAVQEFLESRGRADDDPVSLGVFPDGPFGHYAELRKRADAKVARTMGELAR